MYRLPKESLINHTIIQSRLWSTCIYLLGVASWRSHVKGVFCEVLIPRVYNLICDLSIYINSISSWRHFFNFKPCIHSSNVTPECIWPNHLPYIHVTTCVDRPINGIEYNKFDAFTEAEILDLTHLLCDHQ